MLSMPAVNVRQSEFGSQVFFGLKGICCAALYEGDSIAAIGLLELDVGFHLLSLARSVRGGEARKFDARHPPRPASAWIPRTKTGSLGCNAVGELASVVF